MNDSFALVSGIREHLLESAVMDFANMYRDNPFAKQIDIFRRKGALDYLILFPEGCNLELFAYFVNFVVYSQKPGDPRPDVVGYFKTGSDSAAGLMSGDWIKVTVDQNDTAYDNVMLADGNADVYLYDFSNGISKRAGERRFFETPRESRGDFNHLITAIADPKHSDDKPWWKFW